MRRLFDAIRRIAGRGLSQAEVDAVNAALANASMTEGLGPSTDDEITRLAIKHLEAEEGRVAHAYQDHLGYWTIGIGRLIDKRKGGRLTDAEIDYLLANDLARFRKSLEGWPAWERVKDDPVRAVALLSMAFQMGTAGLAGFKNTLAMIAAGRFADAADNMLESKWAKQTPARAKRVSTMIRTGEMR